VAGLFWSFYRANTFGITLLPMPIEIGIVFWNARSFVGWLLTIAGVLFIFAGVIANLHSFSATKPLQYSPHDGALVGGLRLIARGIQPQERS
jgi:hypothetical protein